MLIQTLQTLFKKDLLALKTEIESYKDETAIWLIDKSISNSAGNLCLHLVGNLNTYLGAVYGGTNYVRDRPLEFSAKDVPRNELIKRIEDTTIVIANALDNITKEQLDGEYPLLVYEDKTSATYMLIHLATHLNYHLGQINYHRRLLDK
jgi:uncharacterized damage-inducible protein DinB